MNKSLLTFGIATLLASSSTTLLAATVTIPNTFTSGTAAVAAEVNDNFTAVKTAVDTNDGLITTNAAGVTTNAGDISTNTTNIGTNTGNISTNTTNIGTNTTDIGINTTNIANLQAATSCSSDMVAVGSLCVDLYEASVWDAATGGTQLSLAGAGGTDDIACNNDGSDCGAIFARSEAIRPSARATWYQAVRACANVGKRLPTMAEWQMAAQGTPTGLGAGCNTAGGVVANTGSNTTCVSAAGAFDMVGNIWEWVADVVPASASEFDSTDNASGYAMGGDYNNSGGIAPSHKVVWDLNTVGNSGLNNVSGILGFRCVR